MQRLEEVRELSGVPAIRSAAQIEFCNAYCALGKSGAGVAKGGPSGMGSECSQTHLEIRLLQGRPRIKPQRQAASTLLAKAAASQLIRLQR